MNRTLRRSLTVTGSSFTALVLLTGTASAHFCYRTDVPKNSKMANGAVWITAEEKVAEILTYNYIEDMAGLACETAVVNHIRTNLADALFMGPGLLAGGAGFQGKAPEGFGYLVMDLRTLCPPPSAP